MEDKPYRVITLGDMINDPTYKNNNKNYKKKNNKSNQINRNNKFKHTSTNQCDNKHTSTNQYDNKHTSTNQYDNKRISTNQYDNKRTSTNRYKNKYTSTDRSENKYNDYDNSEISGYIYGEYYFMKSKKHRIQKKIINNLISKYGNLDTPYHSHVYKKWLPNGTIINLKTNQYICLPEINISNHVKINHFVKIMQYFDIYEITDSTQINLYYDKFNGKWVLGTNSGYDVSDLKYISDKTYKNIFDEIMSLYPNFSYDNLNRDETYTIFISHPDIHLSSRRMSASTYYFNDMLGIPKPNKYAINTNKILSLYDEQFNSRNNKYQSQNKNSSFHIAKRNELIEQIKNYSNPKINKLIMDYLLKLLNCDNFSNISNSTNNISNSINNNQNNINLNEVSNNNPFLGVIFIPKTNKPILNQSYLFTGKIWNKIKTCLYYKIHNVSEKSIEEKMNYIILRLYILTDGNNTLTQLYIPSLLDKYNELDTKIKQLIKQIIVLKKQKEIGKKLENENPYIEEKINQLHNLSNSNSNNFKMLARSLVLHHKELNNLYDYLYNYSQSNIPNSNSSPQNNGSDSK